MCGFCGFTGVQPNAERIIQVMCERIAHRGPDDRGYFSDHHVTLGFVRLSIIDIKDGNQPMFNKAGDLGIVFNGEIYNHESLSRELVDKGYSYKTRSDTETLLHMYEEYGEEMVEHLRGMFAFVIYDKKENKIFGARDHFGIKPFYYAEVNGQLLFGSEIKSFFPHPEFKPKVNRDTLEKYLCFQYSPDANTFFEGVKKLPPGHMFVWKNGLEIAPYSQHSFDNKAMPLQEAVARLDIAVEDSIIRHMTSDVEVGAFLSGGVDSSLLVARFGGKKTFTVGFDYEDYNEIEHAKQLSDYAEAENISKIISTSEYWDALQAVQYHMDEPLADPSAVALFFLSELAAEHVKVVLSGEGADELFGGYEIYQQPLALSTYTRIPHPIRKFFSNIAKKLPVGLKGRNFLINATKTVEDRYIGGAYIFTPEERAEILRHDKSFWPQDLTDPYYDEVKDEDDITKMQYLDMNMWLVDDILLKADKMSMAHGLEVRVPYLDMVVASAASKIPTHMRVNKTTTKIAFREMAKKYIPKETSERRKLGFPVPIRLWLREEKYYRIVHEAFDSEICAKYFHTDTLVALLNEHYMEKRDNSRKIWTVYMFLLWHEAYFV